MGQALGQTPTFLRPGAQELSFDEAWLIAALTAKQAGDADSFAFLMQRRIGPTKRRIFGALVIGLAEILDEAV